MEQEKKNKKKKEKPKKSSSARNLPYSFVDIVIDKSDFVYTATGKTSTYDKKGQIK